MATVECRMGAVRAKQFDFVIVVTVFAGLDSNYYTSSRETRKPGFEEARRQW
jgi:hypothetical protein